LFPARDAPLLPYGTTVRAPTSHAPPYVYLRVFRYRVAAAATAAAAAAAEVQRHKGLLAGLQRKLTHL
jgi:hypothetical protein